MPLKRFKHFIFIKFLFLYLFTSQSLAQQLTLEQIKSAYILNFFKHVQWPNEQQKTSFTLAVYRDAAMYQSISASLNNRLVKNKPIHVQLVQSSAQAATADLVFVSENADTDLSILATELRKTLTLLVTDNSADKHNIMINLKNSPNTSAISFEVNKSNIVFEQLSMSSELLLLGGTEIDVAELYRATELAMQDMRKRESELSQTLNRQTQQFNDAEKRLHTLNQELTKREAIAEQRQIELVSLKKSIDIQQLSIAAKEQQLEEVIAQLSLAKSDLAEKQKLSEQSARENKAMANRIVANRRILEKQQSQLDQQGEQLFRKNEELAERKERIEQQRFYLLVLVLIIAIAAVVSVLIVWLFVKNKRTTRKLSQTLTNLKSMQEQLIQSEKLASLGKLTAGVAHEINTPLGIAVTSTSSALEHTKEVRQSFEQNALSKTVVKKYLHAIEQAAELNMSSLNRVIELLNNFKQVAADQVIGEIRRINLSEYISEIMQTLSSELKRYHVNYQYIGEDDLEVTTVPGAIAQILTNLVTNSLKHGFTEQESGKIKIEVTSALNSEDEEIIRLVYSDDGQGMTNEVLQNIYEPFFTTKRHSGGTGLGMNIVYNIIKQKLHGDIVIESAPQQGSRFMITLPKELAE